MGIKTAMLTGDSHAAAMQANEQVHYYNFLAFICISGHTHTTHTIMLYAVIKSIQ